MESYYYAPDALLNKFVYVTNENRREVMDFFSQFNLDNKPMFSIGYYYGIDKNRFVVGRINPITDIEISVSLTYLKSLWLQTENKYQHHKPQPKFAPNDDKSKEFPRLMFVSESNELDRAEWCRRVVVCKTKDRYWTIQGDVSLDTFLESDLSHRIFPWKYAQEIPEERLKVELTLEQIAKKFNIPVDKLRIKDK